MSAGNAHPDDPAIDFDVGEHGLATIIIETLPSLSMTSFIVKSNVKEALDDTNVSADFYDALDEDVEELIEEAARRAEANGRKTVQPRDL